MKFAYTIVEREGKKYWEKCGAAYDNKDGSINVKLFANPVNGELQLREYTPKEKDFG